jgi:hypothetical protein
LIAHEKEELEKIKQAQEEARLKIVEEIHKEKPEIPIENLESIDDPLVELQRTYEMKNKEQLKLLENSFKEDLNSLKFALLQQDHTFKEQF